MILSHDQIIHEIVENKIVENALLENVNSASFDIRLGEFILVESKSASMSSAGYHPKVLSLKQRDALTTEPVNLKEKGCFLLQPGQFILASSIEVFHLPLHISAEYKLKSSMARIGLEHLNAGWCDAGWNNSVLTLELRNLTTYHEIELCYGDKIGQMIFYKHDPVDLDNSYARKGTYNGDRTVSSAKPEPGNESPYTNCKNCEE
jgi:dCTP deaminase